MKYTKNLLRSFVGTSGLVMLTVSAVVGGSRWSLAADESPLPSEVGFNAHIRPIFTKHCTACHGGVKQAGDVSFVYREQVLPPDGWIVEPGDPDASVLIERVTAEDPEERMPPPDHGPPLSAREIALLRGWVRQGAKWEEHWAYLPPQPQAIPNVKQADWCRQPIDNFVLARLEHEGIAPSADATPERWLRRVTLDLTGLPPSIEDRTTFLEDLRRTEFVPLQGNASRTEFIPLRGDAERDESRSTLVEAAYKRVVDRLLQSPQFGERWASVWLDQVRYADSKGLGQDGRRNIWKYRDWVIGALNRDLPYDEFTVKQIAGDLLPEPSIEDLIATAAHRVTQSNEEGGTDDEEFRIAAVLDRVSTTWQTWQGVTFGCVQCHNHPYDPFRHEEFYQFAAFFNNTADSDLDEDWPLIQAPLNPDDYAAAGKLDREIAALRREIWQREYSLLADESGWRPLVGLTASTSNATKVQVQRQGDHDEFHTTGTVASNADITLESPLPENVKRLTAIGVTALPLDPETAIADSEWGFVLSNVKAHLLIPGDESPRPLALARLIIDEPEPFHDPQESLNPKSREGFAAYSRIHYPRRVALLLESAVEVPDGARLRVTLQHRVTALGAFPLITRRGHLAVSADDRFTSLLGDAKLADKRRQLSEFAQQRTKIASTSVPVMQELPEHLARPTHVFIRGLFLTKDEQVSAGTPASLPALPQGLPPNRLALARWMVSPENSLTARVAVNRFWARLFGTGLVATEEDFGSSGEPPSHPEMLDFLALRFQHEQGWSVKQLLRELVLSRTYRQSSKIGPDLHERDPRNRLLARGPRQRLSAEMVRDQALALAGLISHKRFGPPVHPPIPDGVWQPFQAGDKWDTPQSGEEDRYRRSVYTYTKRSIPYPMFAAFDAPSREFCTPRRLLSNTPLQALMALNDVTFIECSRALAERMRQAAETSREQIRHGFLLATCRPARESELDDVCALYETIAGEDPLAGLTTVAGVLLNLDEVLTR